MTNTKRNTPMMELIEKLNELSPDELCEYLYWNKKKLLEAEKHVIIEAYDSGQENILSSSQNAITYYSETFNAKQE